MHLDPEKLVKPGADEYAPFYHRYLAAIEELNVVDLLRDQPARLERLCDGVSEEGALHRYAAGKWSIKQVIGHVSDTERIFAYRLLRIARADPTPLAGFDEGHYVANGDFDAIRLPVLTEEFRTVREATRTLLQSISPGAMTRAGEANGTVITVRALAYLIPAHAEHHLRMLTTHYDLAAED